MSLDTFAADRQDPNTVLNDLGPWVGRETELAALDGALDRSSDWPVVVLVTGPGGRGKTRLLVEALTQFQPDNSQVPVICLSPGRSFDAAALAELPHTPAVEQARTLVARCVATENEPELKQNFEQTLGRIEDQITIDLRRHQKREDP